MVSNKKPFSEFGGKVQQCVFPLIAKLDDEITPIGTGFIINESGLFITAAHVLEDANRKALRRMGKDAFYNHYEFYALYMKNELDADTGHYLGGLLPVDKVWAPLDLDIGFGMLRLPRNVETGALLKVHPVRLRASIPEIGSTVAALGYYQMKGTFKTLENNSFDMTYEQNTAEVLGTVIDVHPEFREKGLLSFPCFVVDADYDHGLSGGPIFDETGSVCGVVCSGNTWGQGSYGSLIWPVFGCEIEVSRVPNTPAERVMLCDLIGDGSVMVDDSYANVHVVRNPSGTRTVQYRSRGQ